MMRTFAILAGIVLVLFFIGPTIAGFGVAIIVAACFVIGSWRRHQAECDRLVADANMQHAALMEGHDKYGTYGRYPA